MCCKGIALGEANTIVDAKRNRITNDRRLTEVLYRAPGSSAWEKKDWDWALSEIAKRIKKTRDETFEEVDENGVTVNRTQAIAHLGSASVDNEENYSCICAQLVPPIWTTTPVPDTPPLWPVWPDIW